VGACVGPIDNVGKVLGINDGRRLGLIEGFTLGASVGEDVRVTLGGNDGT